MFFFRSEPESDSGTRREDMRNRMAGALLALGTLGAAGAAAAETLSYRYDARGRLVRVERTGGPKSGAVTTYSYDKANNRTNRAVSGAP
jgi:YD repeat-containing protein